MQVYLISVSTTTASVHLATDAPASKAEVQAIGSSSVPPSPFATNEATSRPSPHDLAVFPHVHEHSFAAFKPLAGG
jgi:hypothetical protein